MSFQQYIQTSAQFAQASELAALNAHLREQRAEAALQANLGQALFETEQMADHVTRILPQDLFAAAVLSYDWLHRFRRIEPADFNDVDQKRAWTAAHGTLVSAYRKAQFDREVAPLLTPYFQNRARFSELLEAVDCDPHAYHAAAQRHYAMATRPKPKPPTALRGAAIASGGLFLLAGVCYLAGAKLAAVAFFLLSIIGQNLTAILGLSVASTNASIRRAQRQYEIHRRALEAYSAFAQDPNGGLFLQKMWHEHPLLFSKPPPTASRPSQLPSSSASASVQTFVERHIVERHVVVTRCRFCRNMTPVDAPACQHCGAPGFGG